MGRSISGQSSQFQFTNKHADWMVRDRFEAFDEPWKVQFNSPGKEWEDKWGLMDSARSLKPGLVIPDCGGKSV